MGGWNRREWIKVVGLTTLGTTVGLHALGLDKLGLDKSSVKYVDGELYIRSVSNIDIENKSISFFCDISFGDLLYLVKNKEFVSQTNIDFKIIYKVYFFAI